MLQEYAVNNRASGWCVGVLGMLRVAGGADKGSRKKMTGDSTTIQLSVFK